jgi:beta-glucanase (GH16 family)
MVKMLNTVASFFAALALIIAIGPRRSQGQTTEKIDSGAPPTLAGKAFLAVPGADYQLVWNDEFNAGKLDKARWSIGLPWQGSEGNRWHNNQYASYITDEDVNVSDGQLHLTCRKMDIKGNRQTFHYTEGLITTSGKYSFTYGYAEARCRAPMDAGPGMWPAFWTLSKGWPPEFDIIELWTAEPRLHQGYAYRAPNGVEWKSYHKNGISMDGFHTYAMEWGPGYIFFSIDGIVNNRVYGDLVTSKPEYLILNSGVGSGNGNIAANSTTRFPNSFDVDYCRVYQRVRLRPIVHNAGFEIENGEPWSMPKGVTIVVGRSHAGSHSLKIEAGGSSEQKIYGLKPGTMYRLSAWVQSEKAVSPGRVGVRDFGGEETSAPAKGTVGQAQVTFTTGKIARTAVVNCQADRGGAAYFDDVVLTETR